MSEVWKLCLRCLYIVHKLWYACQVLDEMLRWVWYMRLYAMNRWIRIEGVNKVIDSELAWIICFRWNSYENSGWMYALIKIMHFGDFTLYLCGVTAIMALVICLMVIKRWTCTKCKNLLDNYTTYMMVGWFDWTTNSVVTSLCLMNVSGDQWKSMWHRNRMIDTRNDHVY